MNFRSRALLDLAYQLDCTVRLPGVCTGGTGEPAHANWAIWGKGGAMKSHDFAFCSSCRACHVALDQGSKLSDAEREHYWLRGHVETMRLLWTRGLLLVGDFADIMRSKEPELRVVRDPYASKCHDTAKNALDELARETRRLGLYSKRRKKSRCTASTKTVPRNGWPA